MKIKPFAISMLAALCVCGLAAGQTGPGPSPTTAEARVVQLIDWEPIVSNYAKAIQFFNRTLGLQGNADPSMNMRYYDPVPFLTNMYDTPSQMRNFIVRIPASRMPVEPIQYKDGTPPISLRIQDPGAGYLILKTRNMEGFLPRIAKSGAVVLNPGGRPTTVTRPDGKFQVLWMREPNGFYVELEQPVPLPPAPNFGNGNYPNWYMGADAAFAVEDMDKTLHVYRDLIGYVSDPTTDWISDKAQLSSMGLQTGQYRMTVLHAPPSSGPQPAVLPNQQNQQNSIRLYQFRGVPRKAVPTKKIIDPPTLVLRMEVQNLNGLITKLGAEGIKPLSVAKWPYEIEGHNAISPLGAVENRAQPGSWWIIFQAPTDGVFVQMAQPTPDRPFGG